MTTDEAEDIARRFIEDYGHLGMRATVEAGLYSYVRLYVDKGGGFRFCFDIEEAEEYPDIFEWWTARDQWEVELLRRIRENQPIDMEALMAEARAIVEEEGV